MKCNVPAKSKPRHHTNFENLDRALHDLGMLSTVTDARRDYLRETEPEFCMMRVNTRYVSNVTVGYCMKRTTHKNRLCPYVLPMRHRTKSENSDTVSDGGDKRDFKFSLEPSTSSFGKELADSPLYQTKRCQSLENLNLSDTAPRLETSQDLECVSTQIQRLQVDE